MPRIIAIGNVKSDGTIYNATPGITVDTQGTYHSNMYRVKLPEGFTYNNDYVIQLSHQMVDDGDQDHYYTSIAYLYPNKNGFQVGIYRNDTREYIRGDWSFVLFDL